jgi:hypothetical protein
MNRLKLLGRHPGRKCNQQQQRRKNAEESRVTASKAVDRVEIAGGWHPNLFSSGIQISAMALRRIIGLSTKLEIG